jgi:hypothetical protein
MNRFTFLSAAVIFAAVTVVAGHPYGGFYDGTVTTELSGAVNVEERGIGAFFGDCA